MSGGSGSVQIPVVPNATLRPDIIAGLTASAVILPKAMAYATVAGLPVSVGLYTAFVPMVVYALLGTSRVLSVSSTTTLAILTSAQLAQVVPDGDPAKLIVATATLTLLAGLLLLAASALRLGFVANFISAPVLTGFKAGIGLVIVLDQIPKLLGLHFAKEGFFRDLVNLASHLPEASTLTVLIGVAALVLLILMERAWPHSPAPLAIVGGGIAISWLGSLAANGVSVVGHIPQALPSLTLPSVDLVIQLLPGAIGIALMSFTETIAAGRAFAAPGEPPIRANRELIATGAANIAGALFGAMPAGGGTSQTAVVRATGGRSQKASLAAAAISVATMLVLAPLLGLLPQAVLAAIVIVYSIGLIQPAEFLSIRKVRRMEFRWALAAFVGVLFFGTLQGIVVAIILSLVGLSSQAANARIHVIGRKRGEDFLRPIEGGQEDETFEGLLILRPEGRLFFANAQQVVDRIRELAREAKPRVLMLDLSRVVDIEYSALQAIIEGERSLAEEGIVLWLAGMNPDVEEYVRASGFAETLGAQRMFSNTRAGIRHYQEIGAGT
ncbi:MULTISPECIES: SulP family inorganic anion transporter [unclassified Rhizobium]|uniref:SulP family inorganic anion transporter n=1 Tax=unclassified Rhizobium TaxID=2613769 RepID=UPI0007150E8A|nr:MULTISPECIES: SulP family inorganic anion transporter [unclassified Rhizobium]KQS89489.1 sulfate transporter [Rhizobium sp. Leaf391]KQS94768.1 sulfate transporter [Rhizobium sp. Leaf386]KQU01146.1 sulfate transporter [Rhizobium sp. Leaf453]